MSGFGWRFQIIFRLFFFSRCLQFQRSGKYSKLQEEHVPDIPTIGHCSNCLDICLKNEKKVKIYQIISALTVHHSGLASQINPVPVGRPQTFLPGLERLNYRCTIFVSFFVFKSSKNPKQQNNLICEENSPSALCVVLLLPPPPPPGAQRAETDHLDLN